MCDYKINVLNETSEKVMFEITDTEPAVANKLRQTLLSGVPTMAIHGIEIFKNTSIMNDHELRSRLGLIPIKADANHFDDHDGEELLTSKNCAVFMLKKKCKGKNITVMSSDMKWHPLPGQKEKFPEVIAPVHQDIPILKLKNGQEINIRMVCVKGFGRDHAKWSPVGTATYRLFPSIKIEEPDKDPEELVTSCSRGVFDIEDMNAFVANPLKCNRCQQCVNAGHKVSISDEKGHYVFTSESIGQYGQMDLVNRAIEIASS